MWFTDEGSTPVIGEISPNGAVRTFTAGLPPGSLPAAIAPAPDGHLWFTDEGGISAIGRIATGAPPAFGFDGDRWLRDGVATQVRAAQYHVRFGDTGHRLACRVTATYPAPFFTTAVGRSPTVTVRR